MPPRRPRDTELGTILTRLRDDAGMTQGAAGRALESDPTAAASAQRAVARYEIGRLVPDEAMTRRLLDLYDADDESRARVFALLGSREARYDRVVANRRNAPAFQERWRQLERDAVRVTTFTPLLVPGLLQTDDYAAAVVGDELTGRTRAGWMRSRRARRAILEEPGREFVQLVTAHALLWPLAGAEVMAAQIDHLIAVSSWATVQLGVVPLAGAPRPHVLDGFDLYETAAGATQYVVGGHDTVQTYSDGRDIDKRRARFAELSEVSAWGDDARGLLADLRRWYL